MKKKSTINFRLKELLLVSGIVVISENSLVLANENSNHILEKEKIYSSLQEEKPLKADGINFGCDSSCNSSCK